MHRAGGADLESLAVVWVVNEVVFTHDSSQSGRCEERPAPASLDGSPWVIKPTLSNTWIFTFSFSGSPSLAFASDFVGSIFLKMVSASSCRFTLEVFLSMAMRSQP